MASISLSPAFKQRYDEAMHWLSDNTTGHPNATERGILHIIDKGLTRRGATRRDPDHERWQHMAKRVLERCRREGWDPVEYAAAQVENPETGADYLLAKGIPITVRHFESDKADERHQARARAGIKLRRNIRLNDLCRAGSTWAFEYMSAGSPSMHEADIATKATNPEWDRTEHDSHPHLCWLLLHSMVRCLFLIVPHPFAPPLEAPTGEWTYPQERARLNRVWRKFNPEDKE